MPFCAACGAYCSERECKEDTRGHTEVTGAVSWSCVERVYYCRPCAEGHARTSRVLMWAFGLLGVIGLSCVGFDLVKWLFGR